MEISELNHQVIERLKRYNAYRCGEGTFEEMNITAEQITKDLNFICNSYDAMQNSTIEVMIRFPHVAKYIEQLETKLESAEFSYSELLQDLG